jgi:hypothetical protein
MPPGHFPALAAAGKLRARDTRAFSKVAQGLSLPVRLLPAVIPEETALQQAEDLADRAAGGGVRRGLGRRERLRRQRGEPEPHRVRVGQCLFSDGVATQLATVSGQRGAGLRGGAHRRHRGLTAAQALADCTAVARARRHAGVDPRARTPAIRDTRRTKGIGKTSRHAAWFPCNKDKSRLPARNRMPERVSCPDLVLPERSPIAFRGCGIAQRGRRTFIGAIGAATASTCTDSMHPTAGCRTAREIAVQIRRREAGFRCDTPRLVRRPFRVWTPAPVRERRPGGPRLCRLRPPIDRVATPRKTPCSVSVPHVRGRK